jgi:signal transduction histidine kinase/FixJ family two-component response regulator
MQPSHHAPGAHASARNTVLLVDDEQDIRDLLALLLDDLGFNVLTAADGFQGLTLFKTACPAMVLTDIKMPGLDGIGLLKAIKAQSPETEVLMISGHGDLDLAIASLKFGAADFITKPIDDSLLEHGLRMAQERIALRAQVREHTENLERLVAEKSARLVELERRLAAKQIVEGLSSAMRFVKSGEGGAGTLGSLPCFVSIHNRERRVVSANALYRERLGEPVGRESWVAYGENYPDGLGCPVDTALANGLSGSSRETLIGADGEPFNALVSTTPITGADGGISMVLEIAVDMTEVESLHAELVASHRRYRELFDAVPCAITVQDRSLAVVEANTTFLRDFGASLGQACYAAYKHRAEPCPECPILTTFEDGTRHQSETVVTDRFGEPRNILIWTAPLFDEEGRVEKVMEVSTDITQIRQLQDHLSSLGMMLGSMSHGVKGLLMGLDGGMYRMDSGLRKGDLAKIQSGWDTVRHRIQHIRKMVLDILYYAKSRDLEFAELDLHAFAKDLANLVEGKAAHAGIALSCDFDRAEGRFEADYTALSSALANFLENAIDACLSETTGRPREMGFRVAAEAGRAVFAITDTGVGMDREAREKMFTLFFSSKGSKGTGIGLFISNRIIQQHHGGIEVESSPGEGTRITVWLPRNAPQSPEPDKDAGP